MSLLHVLREERGGALPRELRRAFVVAAALIAMEAMAGIRINVDFAVRTLLLDDLDVGHRDALVLLAEVHLHRNLRLLVGELGDHAAVVSDSASKTGEARRGQERERAAHAEADDGDRSGRRHVL